MGSSKTYSSFDQIIKFTAKLSLQIYIQQQKNDFQFFGILVVYLIITLLMTGIQQKQPHLSNVIYGMLHHHSYNIVMFGWCCEEQQQQNEQLFVYRGSSDHTYRELINIKEINSAILREDNKYQVFAASHYDSLLKKCNEKKEMFFDRQFDIKKQEIPKIKGRKITWKRLKDFTLSFKDLLFQQRTMAEIMDLNENDPYFLATIAALSEQPSTIKSILDGITSFNEQGIYRLNVCVSGKPKQIVVDDLVPVFEDNSSRTAFTKAQQGALWVLLLEKSYAKLREGYGNIASGFAHEVFTTFTVAPCLSHVIPLSFDPASQELLWMRLVQSRKHRYPVVCGSRMRYTCKGIAMRHTYPLVDCWVEDNREHRNRMVRLVNIPTQYDQCEHNGDCNFQVEGDSLKLELVQFMRNFEIIDVAHLRPTYSSHFYAYKSQAGQSKFYVVDVPTNTSFYLTLQHSSSEKGRIRLFLAKVLENSLTDYHLVSCKAEELFSDVTLECVNLVAGRYVVCCQSSLKSECFLRVYSQAHLPLVDLKEQSIKFLQHIFYDYALSSKENVYALSKNSDDWYFSKGMFEQVGLGFLIVNLHNQSALKCFLNYKKDELEKQGFSMVNKADKVYSTELKKCDIEILIFEMNGKVSGNDCLEFPPKAVNIKVVI